MENPEHPEPEVVEPDDALPAVTLADLPETLQDAARKVGWSSLMPVQAKSIPYLRAGRDIMVQSRTGSGKTGAFLLPILERIDPSQGRVQALVLVPTRELARQVLLEAEGLGAGGDWRAVAVYGGVGYGPQLDALKAGAQLVIGTPGRILDHLMRGTLVLDNLDVLVFDEADRMLSMGFYPDIRDIASYLPEKRDGFMFSATFPPSVLSLSKQFLDEPEFLSLSLGSEHVAEMEHVYYVVERMEKDRGLIRVIETENPDAAIIFCNTKANARYVSIVLQRFGYDAEQLSADLSQSARERVLGRMYDRSLRFLVATDLAGRGIDISELSHVILYDFPEDPESYIHRAGRTGRAGAAGTAISLVDVLEQLDLKQVAKKYKIEIVPRDLPSEEEYAKIVSERVTALLEQKLRGLDGLVRERMERMIPLAKSLGDSRAESAIVAMMLDEFYQASLHAPPELPPHQKPPSGGRKAGGGGGGTSADDGDSSSGEGDGGGRRRRRRPRRRGGR